MLSLRSSLFYSSRLVACLVLGAAAVLPASTQTQEHPQSMSGSSTGAPSKAIFDAQHRPITAGGTVASGPVVFQDVTAKAGLAQWKHTMGTPEKRQIIETVGSGVALLDYDGDGWLDIYLVNGSTRAAQQGKTRAPAAALFHNNHDGTFTDVAAKAGVTNERWGFGAVVGDFNNDGRPDIYVSNYGGNRLYRNNGDGTFTDVAKSAGVQVGNWSTGATWGDYDRDGKLDLFVPGYVELNQTDLDAIAQDGSSGSACTFRGVPVMCGPRGLKGATDHLFHNNGDGTFTDVSKRAGVSDTNAYYGLASVFLDINNDGLPDLLVADDSTPNYLYLNKGDGTFEDVSFASGYALNESGRETASMGIASGDFAHTGLLSIFNTTFSDDYKPLYRNDGNASLTDISYEANIAAATVPFLSWGTGFLDFDNDGWLDLLIANGHVYPTVDQQSWGTSYAERPLLFHNLKGKLELMPAVEGSGLAKVVVARGLALGDLFNNGQIDAVINCMDGAPLLLRNVSDQHNHWVGFVLHGGRKSPADGIGTTIYVTANGVRQRADSLAGGSFASSSDPRPHFGLGTAERIETVEVHWPSGKVQTIPFKGAVDRYVDLYEDGK